MSLFKSRKLRVRASPCPWPGGVEEGSEGRGLPLSGVENNFQPAGAATDELSCVALSPALDKADLYSEACARLLCELVVVGPLQAVGLLKVKGLYGEAGEYLVHQQRP